MRVLLAVEGRSAVALGIWRSLPSKRLLIHSDLLSRHTHSEVAVGNEGPLSLGHTFSAYREAHIARQATRDNIFPVNNQASCERSYTGSSVRKTE
jgi:hypothetical protein